MSAKRAFLIVALIAGAAMMAVGISPWVSGRAQAQPPAQVPASGVTIPYAGRLSDKTGQPVADGTYDFTFALYDAAEGGSQLWSETQTGVAVRGGSFTTRLGSVSPLPDGAKERGLWLAVGVRGPGEAEFTLLTPRQALAAPSAGPTGGGACPHDHFGEWWEGSSDLYGLAISNSGTSDGLYVVSAGANGVEVGAAGWKGVYVNSAGSDGVFVYTAGTNPPAPLISDARNGFEVAAAQGNGLYVGKTGGDGVQISSAGGNGVNMVTAGNDGVLVQSAGANGVEVGAAGKLVAGTDGVLVYTAGNTPPTPVLSSASNGFEVAAAQGNGLYVGAAGNSGVDVRLVGGHGVLVDVAGGNGVWVDSAGSNGVEVDHAANDGVHVYGANYAGYFNGNIYVAGNCIGCLQAAFGRNAGDRALQPGDVVAIQGLQATALDNAPSLWNVVPAGGDGAVVGVVSGRAELDVVPEGQELRPGQTGQRLVPRDGAAQPGEYLIIVISGPMRVRAAADAAGSIQPGTRLAVAAGGLARPLQTVVVGGVTLAESAPLLGVALEAPDQDGLVWVLVNPQ